MFSNEKEVEKDIEPGAEEGEGDKGGEGEGDKGQEGGENKKVEKKTFTDEQQLAIHQREAKKLAKKLGIEPEPKQSKQSKSDELGYGEKAYLRAEGIKTPEETQLVRDIMADSGKSLEAVLESKFFQGELKELRAAKAAADGIPKGTKRGSDGTTVDDVNYWIAKDEMPENTEENRALRLKIVNEKEKREKNKGIFAGSGRVIIK